MLILLTVAAFAAPGEAEAIQALSARHNPPPCTALEAGVDDPAAMWRSIAERYEGIPWVPLRAAACLAAHPSARPVLLGWMTTPGYAGLVDVVLTEVERLDLPGAAALTRAALDGPNRAVAERHLQVSPALRARVP